MPNFISSHTGSQIDNAVSRASGLGYGVCSTAANIDAKTVTVDNADYALTIGTPVSIKFTYAVSAGCTLNINNTGAKAIFFNGSPIVAGTITAGQTVSFIYDGTNYNASAGGTNVKIDGDTKGSIDFSVSDNVLVIN